MLPLSEWKTVKQPQGSKICGAAVAAMATGKTLWETLCEMKASYCQSDGKQFYKTREVLKFIGGHGIFTGAVGIATDKFTLRWNEVFTLNICLAGRQAILVVPSTVFEGKSHFVFWDGRYVRDSNPSLPDTTNIEDYEIEEIIPLTYIDEKLEDSL